MRFKKLIGQCLFFFFFFLPCYFTVKRMSWLLEEISRNWYNNEAFVCKGKEVET